MNDKIIIDYNGTRYAYEVTEATHVISNQDELDATSETPKLTLYSSEADGSASGHAALIAKPLGKVAVETN